MQIFNKFKSLGTDYWGLNLIQMIERFAYWNAILQLPIYIAQKDIPGGLHWEHTIKGMIYFWWALVQNLTPVFIGGFADKAGRKNMIIFSSIISIVGYALIATQREVWSFMLAAIILGIGLGSFKPALQGEIAVKLNDNNSTLGWAVYVMLVNLAVFFVPPFSIFIKQISWQALFLSSSAFFVLIIILSLFIDKQNIKATHNQKATDVLKSTFKLMKNPKVGGFTLIVSGFTMIYMQFYETLPNFIFDWIDTSKVAAALNLPDFMLSMTPYGKTISFEWLYILNSAVIILFVVPFSYILTKNNILKAIKLGILLSAIGLYISGSDRSGYSLLLGFIIYSFGEVITNPRLTEYISSIAPDMNKSQYLGLLNLSWAIGLGGGGLLGGWIYKHYGEKSFFAAKYLNENFGLNIENNSKAFEIFQTKMNLDYSAATDYLFKLYNPQYLWLPFVLIGLLSILLLWLFFRKR